MSKRRGRPPLERKRIHISLRLPDWIIYCLDKVARNSGVPRTSLIEKNLAEIYGPDPIAKRQETK